MRRPLLPLLLVLLSAACRSSAQGVEYWAFTGPWDPRSDSATVAHAAGLDVVVTGWIALDSASAQPVAPPLFEDTLRVPEGTVRMALVTTWHGDRFHPETIRALAADPARLARSARAVADQADRGGYEGIVLDFEALEPGDLDALLEVAGRMAATARALGIGTVALAIPATDTAAYPARALLDVADALVVMLYDQHWAGSEPGPIAAPDWVRRALALRIREVGPDPLIAGLPLYGYHWRGGGPAESVSFGEAAARAAGAGVPLTRDTSSGTLRSAASSSQIWATDATLLQRLIQDVRALGVHRFALWRLGQEDPAIWTSVLPRD